MPLRYDEKINALKEALKKIMDNGDCYTFRKSYGDVTIEAYDPLRKEKAYKSLAILKRYSYKFNLFLGFVGLLFSLLFLLIFVFLSTNAFNRLYGIDLRFLNNGFFYLLLIFWMVYVFKSLHILIQKFYVTLNWRNLSEEFKAIRVDSSFLQNELGTHENLKTLIAVITDKMAREEKKERQKKNRLYR